MAGLALFLLACFGSVAFGDTLSAAARYGRALITHTKALIGPGAADPSRRYSRNWLNCQNCHLEAGTKEGGLPLAQAFAHYPKYRARSGSTVTLEDRIDECLTRSMNGRPLPRGSREMRAIVAYLKALSAAPPLAAGPAPIAELTRPADPSRGKGIFGEICAACHGDDGQGELAPNGKIRLAPPLWGPRSFNDGAGMGRLIRVANFVHDNMPNGTDWQHPALSVEDSWDVAAFVLSHPRPRMPGIERDWPDRWKKPPDAPYGPYVDGFGTEQHRLGPFAPIRAALAAHTPSQSSQQP